MTGTAAPVPLVRATGTPYEIGFSYGEQAAAQVRANVAAYLGWFRAAGIAEEAVHELGAGFREETIRRWPRIATTLDGVAAGAGCTAEDVFAVNARTELLANALPGFVDGGCTTIGVLPERTADGHTLLAQNWDWQPTQRDAVVLLATCDERGHAVVTIAEAGMLAKAGFNSAGIGVCVNLLGSDRDGRSEGVPYHVLLRAVLEAKSFGEAVLAAVGSPRGASVNVLVGSGSGELVDLELAPGDAGWVWPSDGVMTHANHFESAVPVVDRLPGYSRASSEYRSSQARRLLAAPRVTREDLAAVLRHHGEHSICCHADRMPLDPHPAATLASVIFDLDDLTVALTPGPPCLSEPVVVGLADVFEGLDLIVRRDT